MSLRALIFDVDGTLADTEELHRQAFNAAFLEFELDWDWTPPRYARLLRVSGGVERLVHYLDSLGLPEATRARLAVHVPALHRTKTRIYSELLAQNRLPLRPGVARLLQSASDAGLKLAIASTTTSANIDALLRARLGGLRGIAFSAIASGDQVAQKKPAPDLYQLVLASLRLPAEACIAFEDSLNGLRAAKAADLVTVVSPTRWNASADVGAADLVVDSLEQVDLERLERLLGAARAAA